MSIGVGVMCKSSKQKIAARFVRWLRRRLEGQLDEEQQLALTH